jgi:hypothetical protein
MINYNAYYSENSHPRRFLLERQADESGVSGTGVVAAGVQFHDGNCVLKWYVSGETMGIYHNGIWQDTGEDVTGIEKVERIHGHNGKTKVVWID